MRPLFSSNLSPSRLFPLPDSLSTQIGKNDISWAPATARLSFSYLLLDMPLCLNMYAS